MRKVKIITGFNPAALESELNKWLTENPQAPIVDMQFTVGNGVFSVMVVMKVLP